MLVAFGARAVLASYQAAGVQLPHAVADITKREFRDWFAIGFLVAGEVDRIERERILLGRSGFLFDQAAQNTGFNCAQ